MNFAKTNVFAVVVFFFCRLYRALEDYDVVRGIFGGKVGTKSITSVALQAEANTDFAEAVKLYNEVLVVNLGCIFPLFLR